jgi:hypothetical protein
MTPRSAVDERGSAYVSTGHLPDPEMVQSLADDACRRFKSNTNLNNSCERDGIHPPRKETTYRQQEGSGG